MTKHKICARILIHQILRSIRYCRWWNSGPVLRQVPVGGATPSMVPELWEGQDLRATDCMDTAAFYALKRVNNHLN